MGSTEGEHNLTSTDPKMESSDDWTIVSSIDEDFSKLDEHVDSQSDIDIIDESDIDENNEEDEEDEDYPHPYANLSVPDDLAHFVGRNSFENHDRRFCQADLSDLSETSSLAYRDELNTEVDLSPGARAYLHHRNSKINVKLNLSLALVLTAVIGLGIGNYIGWSTNWSNKRLSLSHINKLKTLQDELMICVQSQTDQNENQSLEGTKVCNTNLDYWKRELEKLFQESKGLKAILEETQKQFWSNGKSEKAFEGIKCDKIDKMITAEYLKEFHKLKLDFLIKQMEHLRVLKTFEEIESQEQLSQQKLKQLEIENSELKAKLLEESQEESQEEGNSKLCKKVNDDDHLQQSNKQLDVEVANILVLESKIKQLENENNDLKDALRLLQNQMELADDVSFIQDEAIVSDQDQDNIENSKKDDPTNPVKIDLLRQRINSMVQENEDLKKMIGRLRWSNKQAKDLISVPSQVFSSPHTHSESVFTNSKNLDILLLEEEIQKLTQLLIGERNEALKWKNLYTKSQNNKYFEYNDANSDNDEDEDEDEDEDDDYDGEEEEEEGEQWSLDNNVYDWVVSLNVSDILKEKFSNGAKVLADAWEAISENTLKIKESMPGELYQRATEAQDALAHFFQGIISKYTEIQNLNISDLYDNEFTQKYLDKLADLLNSSAKKLQEAGSKLNSNHKSLESRINKLSSKISKIMKGLEIKWTDFRNKLEKKSESSQNRKGSNNWHDNQPETRRRRSKVSEQNLKNWMFKRAKNRAVQRVKSDKGERNWYFKRSESVNVFNE